VGREAFAFNSFLDKKSLFDFRKKEIKNCIFSLVNFLTLDQHQNLLLIFFLKSFQKLLSP